MRSQGVVVYLLLAFGVAWGLWELPIRFGLSVRDPLFQLAALPGAFAPAFAAAVVRRITGEGFADAGLRLKRSDWPYWVFALVLPLAVVAAIVLQMHAFYLGGPDVSLARTAKAFGRHALSPVLANPGVLIPLLLLQAVLFTPILWGEEFGWRGYLQPRLFPGRPLTAATATGLIWGAWHYPLILRGYEFGDQPVLGAAIFTVSTILLSIIFGWLRDRTCSVWAPSLAHSATNVIGGSLMILWFQGGANPIVASYLGPLSWPVFAVVCAALLYGDRRRRRL